MTLSIMIFALVIAAWFATLAWAFILNKAIARPNYPTFLATGRYSDPDVIPVAMYHKVTPRRFEAELQFLRDNHYETISPTQLAAWLNGDQPRLPNRPIVLTFDDGHESLARVAWPILTKFNLTATAAICPAWTDTAEGDKHHQFADPGARYSCWDDLRRMDASGVINVQSHSLDHLNVWIDARPAQFHSPQSHWPYVSWNDTNLPGEPPAPPLGMPIFAFAPKFSAPRRFIPDPAAQQACTSHVARSGGPDFFRRPDWRSQLRTIIGCAQPEALFPGHFESADQRAATMLDDLARAKSRIEGQLNKTVDTLVFPWNEACPLATTVAAQAGYKIIFRGHINGRDLCRRDDDPRSIPRFGSGTTAEQFVRSLPGRGRRTTQTILLAKTLSSFGLNRDE